eukprot:236035_1
MCSFPKATTPNSPISPNDGPLSKSHFLYDDDAIDEKSNPNLAIISVLHRVGFDHCSKISDSLQGSVWRATRTSPKGETKRFVIKATSQFLYTHSQGIVNGKSYAIKEDILLEQSILKYLTQDDDCPASIVQWHQFFKSDTDLFLVMEDAGSSLFDFVQKAHNLIRTKKIDIAHWHHVCHLILQQMIECIDYIHSKKVAHFDISLENWLINDVEIDVTHVNGCDRITFVLDDLQVKLCDFGLAQIFTNSSFLSTKYCGKDGYKSPKIVRKNKFNAKSNDIWCIGVCMFALCTGIAPWSIASTSDANFAFVQNHGLRSVLRHWKALYTVDEVMYNVIEAILQPEEDRVNVGQIKRYLSVQMKL